MLLIAGPHAVLWLIQHILLRRRSIILLNILYDGWIFNGIYTAYRKVQILMKVGRCDIFLTGYLSL